LFYIIFEIPPEQYSSILFIILDLLKKKFDLNFNEIEDLKNNFQSNPILQNQQNKIFIMKGSCGILIPSTFQNIFKIPNKLHSIWNGFFMVLLAHHTKPILISEPESFKAFLSSLILQTAAVLKLHQETIISQ
jgi:hypothetical protein